MDEMLSVYEWEVLEQHRSPRLPAVIEKRQAAQAKLCRLGLLKLDGDNYLTTERGDAMLADE